MLFRKFKSFARDYFTLTSRERKGALSLATIIIVQVLILFYLNFYSDADDSAFADLKIEIFNFVKETENKKAEKKIPSSIPLTFEPFDPNTATKETWMSMGLSAKQAGVIENYLTKGGRFRNKQDVAKMYGIMPHQFEKMEPYIFIPEVKKVQPDVFKKIEKPVEKKKNKININRADTIMLSELPMVGAGRARMIWKYRESLGGFSSIDQLLEVFTIDSAVFEVLKPHIIIDITIIKKININSDQLKHPYISRTLAKAIAAYRKQHGDFLKPEDLKKLNIIDEQLYSRLVPYIDIQ